MGSKTATDTELGQVTAALVIDREAAVVAAALEAAGLPFILIKGRPLASALYDDKTRGYLDADLLVDRRRADAVGAVLTELGYRRWLSDDDQPQWIPKHAFEWIAEGKAPLDVHFTLRGLDAEPEVVWEAFASHRVPAPVGGRELPALDAAGLAFVVAVHAAANGPDAKKPVEDVTRAVARIPHADWVRAVELAGAVGGTNALVAGLGLARGGDELAAALGVGGVRSVQVALDASGAPVAAHGIEEIARTRGLRAKARIVTRALFPSPEFMRLSSPLAQRGRMGLVLAYARRPLWLAGHTPGAVMAWARARQAAKAP